MDIFVASDPSLPLPPSLGSRLCGWSLSLCVPGWFWLVGWLVVNGSDPRTLPHYTHTPPTPHTPPTTTTPPHHTLPHPRAFRFRSQFSSPSPTCALVYLPHHVCTCPLPAPFATPLPFAFVHHHYLFALYGVEPHSLLARHQHFYFATREQTSRACVLCISACLSLLCLAWFVPPSI